MESYLRYQGSGFTRRFDANSYLYITRAMDYFDLAEEFAMEPGTASWPMPSPASEARFCLVSFDTDWLYPTAESRHIVHALNAAGAPVSFVELSAPYGHDSFLLDVPPPRPGGEGVSGWLRRCPTICAPISRSSRARCLPACACSMSAAATAH